MIFAQSILRKFSAVPKKDRILEVIELIAPLDESLAIELGCHDLIFDANGVRRPSLTKVEIANVYFGPAISLKSRQEELIPVGGNLAIPAVQVGAFVTFLNSDNALMLKFKVGSTGSGHGILDFLHAARNTPIDVILTPKDDAATDSPQPIQFGIAIESEEGNDEPINEPAAAPGAEVDSVTLTGPDGEVLFSGTEAEFKEAAERAAEGAPQDAYPKPDSRGIYTDEKAEKHDYTGKKAHAGIRVLEIESGWISAWLVVFDCGNKQKQSQPLNAEHVFASETEAREAAALSAYTFASRALTEAITRAEEVEAAAIMDWVSTWIGKGAKA